MKEIPLFKVYMSPEAKKVAGEVLDSGYVGQGPKVEEFENLLKTRFENDYVATTNSATSAEHLAIHLLKDRKNYVRPTDSAYAHEQKSWPGISRYDEILTTPLTCTATNWPILANDINIKWVDVDPNTMNMDLDDLERKITRRTKAIMVVHWGGYPVDLDRLKQIQIKAEQVNGFKPAIIEDCAHSFGSTYKGVPLGSHGNICTFSFQAIKHFTSVDGGALVLPNADLYERAKLLRWYGIDRESNRKDFRCEANISEWGYKFHMNDLNASIGMANLAEVDNNVIKVHKENAAYYNENLKDVPGVTLLENKDDRESSYWIYTMKVEDRDNFVRFMKSKGVVTSRVHERNDLHTCVAEFKTLLPNLDKVVQEMICIPVGWWVTPENREYIVSCIKEFYAS